MKVDKETDSKKQEATKDASATKQEAPKEVKDADTLTFEGLLT